MHTILQPGHQTANCPVLLNRARRHLRRHLRQGYRWPGRGTPTGCSPPPAGPTVTSDSCVAAGAWRWCAWFIVEGAMALCDTAKAHRNDSGPEGRSASSMTLRFPSGLSSHQWPEEISARYRELQGQWPRGGGKKHRLSTSGRKAVRSSFTSRWS